MASPTESRPPVRLVRPARSVRREWLPDAEAERAIEHRRGRLRVVGGPGSGKTSMLARAAAARLNEGAEAGEVLLLTFSRRSAAALRDALVAETTVALREVPVRSFESYAWGVLDRAGRRQAEWSAPRLITGPEQDAIIRDLLHGALEGEGRTTWPDDLRAALPTRGFAGELRDALMRCAQHGISAGQLRRWADEHDRPVWRSLSSFLTEYSGVTGMRLEDSYDPAELVRAVVDLWRGDPDELLREHRRLGYLYVDEAEELDPAKRELVELLAEGVPSVVLAGDVNQSVFGFRGADRRALADFAPESTVSLSTGYRSSPGVVQAVGSWSATWGAVLPQCVLAQDEMEPLVAVRAASGYREAAEVAALLRERHLVDGVPWSEMCVISRSAAAILPAVKRAFAAAGVPLDLGSDEPPVGQSAAVRSLVDLVRLARTDEPSAATVEELLRSPYFRHDALTLRRMRRALRAAETAAGGGRSSTRVLAEIVAGRADLPEDADLAGLRELTRILARLRADDAAGASGEELLHAAWRETGAQERWRVEALSGGRRGADADQRLDAVIAAFAVAASLSSRLREADFETIAKEIEEQELPADRLGRAARAAERVSVLSANNAKGRQWEVVAVVGVQDGGWPNLVPRNTILRTEELADLASGLDGVVLDRRAQLLQEERRLFYVALTRARRQVILSAVEGPGERPSRFYDEVCEHAGVAPGQARQTARVDRSLSMIDHLAQLRACLVDPDSGPADRAAAAQSLRMLAEAGVPGAAPADWYAVRKVSTDEPIGAEDVPVRISPSAAATFQTCQLQWFLGRVGSRPQTINATVGTLVHAAFEAVGETRGRTHAELVLTMRAVIDDGWAALDIQSPWEDRRWRAIVEQMIERMADWLLGRDTEWVGNEREFDVVIGRARIRGSVDRLERDRLTGELYTIDLKTGSTAPSHKDALRHPQLGLYQLAAEHGAFGPQTRSGGAELFFPRVGNSGGRTQPALSRDEDPQWAHALAGELAEGMAAGSFTAQPSSACRNCDFRSVCPAIRSVGEDEL